MGIIFGKKKVSRITEQDKAVLQLKKQRDLLKQYQKKIENALATDRELAKKLLDKGQRDRAKLLLRKKKFQEQLLAKTDVQLDNLEQLTHDIEFSQVELQVVEGLKQGNEALKKVNEALKIADIESILDETQEGIEKQKEISDLLSGQLTEEDEEAVEEELAGIINEQLPNVPEEVIKESGKIKEPIDVELPEVPREKIASEISSQEGKKKGSKEPVALEA